MLKKIFLNERLMLTAITINAVIIYTMYFPEWKHNEWLEHLDHLFVLIFVIEAIVKLAVMGRKAYFADSWNVFDFLVVVVSLPGILSYFIPIPNTSILLIFRLVRLVRVVRFFSIVPHLNAIMEGLIRALRASVFVLIALLILNVILALFTCHMYSEIMPEHFGNPLISSFTIFQMCTVEGWYEIPQLVSERTDSKIFLGASRFYFVMVVLFGGIFGMSLANAIFVDEMTSDNNRALESQVDVLQQQIAQLQLTIGELNDKIGFRDSENG